MRKIFDKHQNTLNLKKICGKDRKMFNERRSLKKNRQSHTIHKYKYETSHAFSHINICVGSDRALFDVLEINVAKQGRNMKDFY